MGIGDIDVVVNGVGTSSGNGDWSRSIFVIVDDPLTAVEGADVTPNSDSSAVTLGGFM